jgi:two-component system sensor histidine kinase RegB
MRYSASTPAGSISRRDALQRIFWLRSALILGVLLIMLWAEFGLGVRLPWMAMALTLLLMAGLNAFTAWRARQLDPAKPAELFAQILADITALAVLLLYTGGWANPFVSLLLLPVVLASLLLPAWMAWATGGMALAAYSLLAYVNVPLYLPPEKAFYLHISGMWFNFAVSVGVVVFMVLRLRNLLRDREHELASYREENLRNEQVVAVALTAASAAHELGTPLNTLALLNENLLADADADKREDLELMRTQIARCRKLLQDLSRTAQAEAANVPVAADRYLSRLAEEWRLLRPAVEVEAAWAGQQDAPLIQPPTNLDQSLINLLNNAADAAPGPVLVQGKLAKDGLQIDILDAGPGPAPALRAMAEPGRSSKGGLGLGLFLSNASIENLAGQVTLSERENGGTCVSVWLPLRSLQAGLSQQEQGGLQA